MSDSTRGGGYAAMTRVRAFLGNGGFRRHALLAFNHSSACAAADAYGDAELAISAFSPAPNDDDLGRNYIEIYGVLQAAYLQGNALIRLYDACGMGQLDLPPEVKELRDIRNDAVAHPAPRPARGALTATFLGRYTIGSGALALHQYASDGTSKIRVVNLAHLLTLHSAHCDEILAAVAGFLESAERETRRLIAEKGEVVDLLHPSWPYLISKIREASHGLDIAKAIVARAGLPSLESMLGSVQDGQERLGLQPVNGWHIDMARAGIRRLEALLDQLADGNDVTLDVAAFADLLDRHFSFIQAYLEDTDKELRTAP